MENKVSYLAGWWLREACFLFFVLKKSHLLITTFGVLCMIDLLIVTAQLALLLGGDLHTDMFAIYSLASRNHQWEILFMVMMAMVMIIDSHYYKHHYYLVLINNGMKGALKNTELDSVLANGLIRKKWQKETPSVGWLGKIRSREMQLTKNSKGYNFWGFGGVQYGTPDTD